MSKKKWYEPDDKDMSDLKGFLTSPKGLIFVGVLVVAVIVAFVWELFL